MKRVPPSLTEEELKENLERVVDLLSKYLQGYVPKRPGLTKHSVMGPVGKLISAMEASRFNSEEGYVGYTVNVHENTGVSPPSKEGIAKLREAVSLLLKLKLKVGISRWPKILREIDYAVYFNKMMWIRERRKVKEEGE
jgi:hypothetical protein